MVQVGPEMESFPWSLLQNSVESEHLQEQRKEGVFNSEVLFVFLRTDVENYGCKTLLGTNMNKQNKQPWETQVRGQGEGG